MAGYAKVLSRWRGGAAELGSGGVSPKQGSRMAYDVSRLSTAKDARAYLDNVRRLGRTDLYPDAFRRLCELEGQDHGDPLVIDF